MEGYSVTEAASVLGVPTERVWELLARGVLSGVPDGETGMRVFLQPRPAPIAVDESPRGNGHGVAREPDAEASPFRELLTEFRNLTERYGQALLALGEARGEVASLRSRVDVLEARMDLRLPLSSPMPGGSTWPGAPEPASQPQLRPAPEPSPEPMAPDLPEPAPAPESTPAPEPQPAVEAEAPPSTDDEPGADRSARRKRGRPHFSDDFAEALARAEDPSPPVLPGAEEAAAAFAALQREVPARAQRTTPAEPVPADASLPRELPPADSIAVAEPEVEPQEARLETAHVPHVADAPEAASPESASEADLEAAAPPAVAAMEAEPEPGDAPMREPEAEQAPVTDPVSQPEAEAEPEPELAASPPSESSAAAPDAAEPEADSGAEPGPEPEPAATWDQQRYTTEIEEPDWWTPEASVWEEPSAEPVTDEPAADQEEPAVPGIPDGEASEMVPVDASAEAETPTQSEATADEPRLGEEPILWYGRRPPADPSPAWPREDAGEEMEVASTGRHHTPAPTQPNAALPGADELDDALASLDAVTQQGGTRMRTQPLASPEQPRPAGPVGEIRSPASRAYRRLRRIFPG